MDADVARKYAIVFMSLQKKETKIPINDVWIAASCMEIGGPYLQEIDISRLWNR